MSIVAVAVGAAGLTVGGILLFAQRRRRVRWVPPKEWCDNAIELLWSESSLLAGGGNPPVSALSFFTCDEEHVPSVEAWIRARVAAIAAANPWIAGRLVNLHDKRQLVHPTSIGEDDLERLVLISPPGFAPQPSMSPEELSVHYQKVELPSMGDAYDQSDVLASRFVTSRTESGLCILFTMSHVVGDGITFYSIFNQLSSASAVVALPAKRKPQFDDPAVGVQRVLGADMNKALMRPSSLLSMLAGMATGASPRLIRRIVDAAALAASKAEAKQAAEVPFVSSNDILTSAFATKVLEAGAPSVCIMAMNMRGRIAGIDATDMGNYENGLLFDAACSATPSRVRKALLHPEFKCRQTPLPPLSAAFSSKYCLISNWASGSAALVLPHCAESLHQPVFNIRAMAHALPFDVAMIFRAAASPSGRLGLMWFTRAKGTEADLVAGLPLEHAWSSEQSAK